MSAPGRARSAAQLRLRTSTAELTWPAGAATGVLALLTRPEDDAGPLFRLLADALSAVTLSASAQDGAAAVEWIADHAAELGADGARLILAGVGGAAAAVAALAIRTRDGGWPRITHQLLIGPRLDGPPPARLDGVAPATIIGGDAGARAYAAALRRAGVPARELADIRDVAGFRY